MQNRDAFAPRSFAANMYFLLAEVALQQALESLAVPGLVAGHFVDGTGVPLRSTPVGDLLRLGFLPTCISTCH